MVINYNNKKILFVHIGGNAGTSISWYLWSLSHPNQHRPAKYRKSEFHYIDTMRDQGFMRDIGSQHMTFKKYIENNIEFDVSFAVIRNPFDRILAKFFTASHSAGINETNAKQKFNAFIKEIYEHKTHYSVNQALHTGCQERFIFSGSKRVDYILRFENLQNNFNEFCKINKLPEAKLILCNSTFHKLKSTAIYDIESKQIVYEKNKFIIDKYYS